MTQCAIATRSHLHTMENRTHIEPIPFLSPTGKIYVTVLCRRIIFIEHHIDESLIRRFRVERHFVALKSTGGICHSLRPVDDEALSLSCSCLRTTRPSTTRPKARPYTEICQRLWVRDFDRSSEIPAFDCDLRCLRFCKHLGRYQQEESDQNRKQSLHGSPPHIALN